jgi:hypothetical protein
MTLWFTKGGQLLYDILMCQTLLLLPPPVGSNPVIDMLFEAVRLCQCTAVQFFVRTRAT